MQKKSRYAGKQQTIRYISYIRYLFSNALLFNAVLLLDHELPKNLQRRKV